MRASRRLSWTVLVCLMVSFSITAAAQSDQAIAERVLGPQWKLLSQRAGMVFAGTVLSEGTAATKTEPSASAIDLSFRVDRAIAGVEPGKVLTIREWDGAWSRQRPMRRGEHILLFLYPPSRLGLTSPVGGSQGQIALDASGTNVVERTPLASIDRRGEMSPPSLGTSRALSATATVVQLERAIRAARGE